MALSAKAMTDRLPGMWGVRDRTANRIAQGGQGFIPRMHTPVVGVDYFLSSDKRTEMPEAHARVFLRGDAAGAFEVTDANGAVVAPLNDLAHERTVPESLPPNAVIASLDELTAEALRTRVVQYPGGTDFKHNAQREPMIEFLRQQQEGGHVSVGAESDGAAYLFEVDGPKPTADELMARLTG